MAMRRDMPCKGKSQSRWIGREVRRSEALELARKSGELHAAAQAQTTLWHSRARDEAGGWITVL